MSQTDENEVRSERIIAGQAAARANGKTWGGSEKGRRVKVTDEQVRTIERMHSEGATKAAMSRAPGYHGLLSTLCLAREPYR